MVQLVEEQLIGDLAVAHHPRRTIDRISVPHAVALVRDPERDLLVTHGIVGEHADDRVQQRLAGVNGVARLARLLSGVLARVLTGHAGLIARRPAEDEVVQPLRRLRAGHRTQGLNIADNPLIDHGLDDGVEEEPGPRGARLVGEIHERRSHVIEQSVVAQVQITHPRMGFEIGVIRQNERPDATDAHEHGGHLGLQDLLLRGDRQIAGFATSAQTREQQVKTVLAATYGARYMEVSSVRTRSSPSTASLGGSSV